MRKVAEIYIAIRLFHGLPTRVYNMRDVEP